MPEAKTLVASVKRCDTRRIWREIHLICRIFAQHFIHFLGKLVHLCYIRCFKSKFGFGGNTPRLLELCAKCLCYCVYVSSFVGACVCVCVCACACVCVHKKLRPRNTRMYAHTLTHTQSQTHTHTHTHTQITQHTTHPTHTHTRNTHTHSQSATNTLSHAHIYPFTHLHTRPHTHLQNAKAKRLLFGVVFERLVHILRNQRYGVLTEYIEWRTLGSEFLLFVSFLSV